MYVFVVARLCAICVLVFVFRRWQVLSPRVFLHKMGLLTWLVFSSFVICYSTMEDEFIAFLLFYFHLLLMKMHLMWLLGLSSASSVSIMEGKTKACQPEDKPQQLHHGKQNPNLTSRKEQTNQGQLSTQAAQKLFSYICKHAHLHRLGKSLPNHIKWPYMLTFGIPNSLSGNFKIQATWNLV